MWKTEIWKPLRFRTRSGRLRFGTYLEIRKTLRSRRLRFGNYLEIRKTYLEIRKTEICKTYFEMRKNYWEDSH